MSTIKRTRLHEVHEIFVIGYNCYREVGSNKPRLHISEAVNNRQEFFIMGVIIDFYRTPLLTVKWARVKKTRVVRL